MVPYLYHKAVVRRLWAKIFEMQGDHAVMVAEQDKHLKKAQEDLEWQKSRYYELEGSGETFHQRCTRERKEELEEEVTGLYASLDQAFEETRLLQKDRAMLLRRLAEQGESSHEDQ